MVRSEALRFVLRMYGSGDGVEAKRDRSMPCMVSFVSAMFESVAIPPFKKSSSKKKDSPKLFARMSLGV